MPEPMAGPRLSLSLEPARESAWLAGSWQDLEREADASFFQTWAWIGNWLACLPERIEPLCLSARLDGDLMGLALVTPRRTQRHIFVTAQQLHTHTTGEPELDAVAVEYNGLLLHRQATPETAAGCLAHLLRQERLCEELYLDGVKAEWEAVATRLGWPVQVRKTEVCPFLELCARDGRATLDRFSRNTRQQITRSRRLYGHIELEVARDISKALDIWADLRSLHHDYWHGKGEKSAFDNAGFDHLHMQLMNRCLETGQIQLLRVRNRHGVIGCLYNFVHRSRVYAYLSGFRMSPDNRLKPGLVCHYEAIELNRRLQHEVYDFLAGDARYKRSLSNRSNKLTWLVVQRPRADFWLENKLKRLKTLVYSR